MGHDAIVSAFVLCAPIKFKFWCHFAINCNWMSWIFISQPTILHNVTYLYQSALWELPCEYYWLTFTFIPTFTLIFMCWRLRLFWRICATETDVFTLGSWLRQKVCPYILRFNLLMVFCLLIFVIVTNESYKIYFDRLCVKIEFGKLWSPKIFFMCNIWKIFAW